MLFSLLLLLVFFLEPFIKGRRRVGGELHEPLSLAKHVIVALLLVHELRGDVHDGRRHGRHASAYEHKLRVHCVSVLQACVSTDDTDAVSERAHANTTAIMRKIHLTSNV